MTYMEICESVNTLRMEIVKRMQDTDTSDGEMMLLARIELDLDLAADLCRALVKTREAA